MEEECGSCPARVVPSPRDGEGPSWHRLSPPRGSRAGPGLRSGLRWGAGVPSQCASLGRWRVLKPADHRRRGFERCSPNLFPRHPVTAAPPSPLCGAVNVTLEELRPDRGLTVAAALKGHASPSSAGGRFRRPSRLSFPRPPRHRGSQAPRVSGVFFTAPSGQRNTCQSALVLKTFGPNSLINIYILTP